MVLKLHDTLTNVPAQLSNNGNKGVKRDSQNQLVHSPLSSTCPKLRTRQVFGRRGMIVITFDGDIAFPKLYNDSDYHKEAVERSRHIPA